MDALILQPVAPTEPAIRAVLEAHHALMRAQSPAESCHVLDPRELSRAAAKLFAAWRGKEVVGVGALAPLGQDTAELKSMHTIAAARGRGVGRAMLTRLMDEARSKNIRALYLETGSAAAFAPARALYASAGFVECAPFGSYVPNPFSVFMTCVL